MRIRSMLEAVQATIQIFGNIVVAADPSDLIFEGLEGEGDGDDLSQSDDYGHENEDRTLNYNQFV